MSTLTRTNNSSHNNRNPKYKDYMSFVDSYRFGKNKDDQNSVITNTSGDSGVSFSLNSSANNSSSSIYSDMSNDGIINSNNNNNNNKKIVKSEVFIEIKNPSPVPPQQFPSQVFKLEVVPQQKVSNTAKMFETNKMEKMISASKPNNMRQNSIDQLSKKFESTITHADGNNALITNKPPLKRAESIGKVSKIFEQSSLELNRPSSVVPKTKNFNSVPKPFPAVSSSATKPAISPKPLITSSAPVFPKFSSASSETASNYADSVDSALSSLSVSPSPPQCVSPQPPQFRELPPPPPPLPPMNFSASISKSNNHIPKQIPVQTTPINNNYNNSSNNTTIIDKNDPRVKKAVYGALRNMYGAYHDQANDYLATLPKNRVRKNNGLDSIIDSIASQGGLGKLTGRVNPKQELE